MPEKIIIGISVEKKIAKADENAVIVCGNSNYKAVFAFDSEWADYPVKTALFATDNKGGTDENNTIPVVFDGNECDIPQLANTTIVGVGVVSGDLTVGDQVEVSTTTPAYIPCLISIKDLGGVIAPPATDVYDQIIALLNKYIQQGGGGGSGGTDEERVREIVAEETADLDDKTDALSTEIAVINTVLEQSGLVSKYKATIEDTYNERVTADGANVLDGSKAKLEKVVGSTVACKNLFDKNKTVDGYEIINAVTGELKENNLWFVTDYISVLPKTNYVVSGKPSGSVVICFDANKNPTDNVGGGNNQYFTTRDNTAFVRLNGLITEKDTFQLEQSTTATAYQPYFTGLKSASFAGIESTNADSTETATLDFPKTETPLGTTIDFVNKKITGYGVDLVLTGTERISFSDSIGGGSVYISNALKSIENNAIGVCTDARIVQNHPSVSGDMQIGDGREIIFWKGILKQIGAWENEESSKTQAIEDFKVYLAQRYSDGNPVTIRYVSSTLQSETDFTADNEYTAYKGGTETVLENDGKDYGADNTLSQNYIIVTGVK